ncbi:MAG: TonB-dependent receptor, partial [Alphaproteobacteria bacterium]
EYFFAGFAQDTIGLTDRLSITPGLRFEHVIRESTSGTGVSGHATISDILPSLHAVYRAGDRVALRASISRQVNRPKFDELAPFQDEKPDKITAGNPDLKPARAWSLDVGGDYTSRNLFFGVNLFHRQIKDVIEQVDTGIDIGGKDLFRVENVGDGFVQGIELEQRVGLAILDVPVLEHFSVRANQTFIRSRLEDRTGQTRPFKQQPDMIANASLVYERPESGTSVSLSGNYVSSISNDDAVKEDTTRREFFLDFYAETRIYGAVSIFGWVQNITGEERHKIKIENAKTEITDEDTGRSFFIGLKAKF